MICEKMKPTPRLVVDFYTEGVTCGSNIVECEANKVSNGICNEGLCQHINS